MKRVCMLGGLGVLLTLTVGCRATPNRFGRQAFYQAAGLYRIRYRDAARYDPGPASWTLQNFSEASRGRPRPLGRRSQWATAMPIEGGRVVRVPRLDLLFRSGSGGVLWTRTVMLGAPWRDASVPELLRLTARALLHNDGAVPPVLVDEARTGRLAGAEVVDEGPVVVDGRAGRYLTVDLSSATGDAPTRVTVVLIDTGRATVRRGWVLPVVFSFGLASRVSEHDEGLRSLQALVSRVDFAPGP